MERVIRIEAYSRDRALLQYVDECREFLREALTAEGKGSSSPKLGILDARDLSQERLHASLADPKALGDLVLVLVNSNEKIVEAYSSYHGPCIDFLVWPTARNVLASRIQLLLAFMSGPPAPALEDQEHAGDIFRAATEGLPFMVLSSEAGGHRVFMNAAMRRFFGIKARSIAEFGWPAVTHHEARAELVARIEAAIQNHQPYETTILVVGGDNDWHSVDLIGKPHYYPDGSYSGSIDTMWEITEQSDKEASLLASMRLFKELANFVPFLIWQTDPKGTLTYANERWYTYTGLPRHALRQGEWIRIFHSDDQPKMAVERRPSSTFRLESRIQERDGAYKWHATFVTPIQDASGRLKKWIGTAMDIDARKANAEEIKRLYQEWERKRQTKDNFLAALSHELRTPLNIVLGYCQLLLDTLDLPTRESACLQGIATEANKILAMVDQLPWSHVSQPPALEDRANHAH